jgi:hypothetical protein
MVKSGRGAAEGDPSIRMTGKTRLRQAYIRSTPGRDYLPGLTGARMWQAYRSVVSGRRFPEDCKCCAAAGKQNTTVKLAHSLRWIRLLYDNPFVTAYSADLSAPRLCSPSIDGDSGPITSGSEARSLAFRGQSNQTLDANIIHAQQKPSQSYRYFFHLFIS